MNNIKPGSFKYRQMMDRKLKRASKPSAVLKNPCLKSTMEKLYEKRSTTGDIKFMVDGEVIHAHRCVLAALSPRYEAQFYGAMAETNTINVTDVSPAAFKEFLQFFYTDEVTLTLDNIEDVLNLAKQSLVDELVAECTNFILNVVGMDKLFWSYRLAVDYDIKLLEDFCVKQIKTNIKTVFQMTGFLSCERDLLCRILSIDSLNCQETEVFDACILWAQAKCKRDGLDATNTANLRAASGEALPKIQSRSKKIKEFTGIIDKRYVGILSTHKSNDGLQAAAMDYNKQSNLECSISKGQRIRRKSSDASISEIIKFSCDKAIKLNGFVVYNRIFDDTEVNVDVGGRTHSPKHTVIVSDLETKIVFDDPIQILDGQSCYIRIESASFCQFNAILYGFEVKSHFKENGITFHFSDYSCNKMNFITRLLFNVIE